MGHRDCIILGVFIFFLIFGFLACVLESIKNLLKCEICSQNLDTNHQLIHTKQTYTWFKNNILYSRSKILISSLKFCKTVSKSRNFFPLFCCFVLYMNRGDAVNSFFCIDILHCICRLLTFTWKLLISVCLDQKTAVLLETAKLNYLGKICKLTVTTIYYLFMLQCCGKRGKIIHCADLKNCVNSIGLVRNCRVKNL